MKRKICLFSTAASVAAALLPAVPAAADRDADLAHEGKVSVYADISGLVEYNSRERYQDQTGTLYLLPKLRNVSSIGNDFNDKPSTTMLASSSRIGVKWEGWEQKGIGIDARIDGDFLLRTGNQAQFRLMNAYAEGRFPLPFGIGITARAGQRIHPMAEDYPDVLSLSAGAPFSAYNYSPQITLSGSWHGLSLELAAVWQMQYCSTGFEGYSSRYINYGSIPELYAAISYSNRNLSVKAGGEYLDIRPRTERTLLAYDVDVWTDDHLRTLSPYIYGQYTFRTGIGDFTAKAKSIFAQDATHLTLPGGYAICGYDGISCTKYTPFRSSASWIEGLWQHGRYRASLMGGYLLNLGTGKAIYTQEYDTAYLFREDDMLNLLDSFRGAANFTYTWKHIRLGLEYEWTGTNYGTDDTISLETGKSTREGAYMVQNHCVLLLISCRF